MAFMVLAGVDIDISADGCSEIEGVVVGDMRRAFDGTPRVTIRTVKRAWRGTGAVLTPAQDAALRAAIANRATVTLTGDIVGGASFSVMAWITDDAFVMDGMSFRRAPVINIEQV